jgi:hypothetical protein
MFSKSVAFTPCSKDSGKVHLQRFLCLVLFSCGLAQDLFLPIKVSDSSHTLLKGVASNSSLNFVKGTQPPGIPLSGATAKVFTFSPDIDQLRCMDVAIPSSGELHGAKIQLWGCNGHENQLWYFDSGSSKIVWGGDSSKCIDAGTPLQAGTELYLWDCNGLKQQTWWYDSGAKTVFLAESGTDATWCMDLTGGLTDYGQSIELWGCDGWRNQQWNLLNGITIRTAGYAGDFCLDLEGGITKAGTKVQMWSCNGLLNQKWIFDPNSWQIRPISDPSKCLDGGKSLKTGEPVMIWDCNGEDQQVWGFDASTQSVYLAKSTSDASLCLDLSNGMRVEGGQVGLWQCNGCWNQKWILFGPNSASASALASPPKVSAANESTKRGFLQAKAPMNCPGFPGATVAGHCMSGDQHGWPVFQNQKELYASGAWANYFKAVYGEVPSDGYPICTGNLAMIYSDQAFGAGIKFNPGVSGWCPKADGTLYNEMGFSHKGFYWLYNHVLSQPYVSKSGTTGLPGKSWVEVIHSAYPQDGEATWLYYTPGSAMWLYLGNTQVYNDHPDATQDLLGKPCKYQKGDLPNECELQFSELYAAAVKRGLSTFQFLYHSDMACGGGRANLAIEIVDVRGPGREACSGMGGSMDMSRWRAGWEAKNQCWCDTNLDTLNCKGYGMWR